MADKQYWIRFACWSGRTIHLTVSEEMDGPYVMQRLQEIYENARNNRLTNPQPPAKL